MESEYRDVSTPNEEPNRQPGSTSAVKSDFELRNALESVELEDEVDRIEREVDEGMRSQPGTQEHDWASDLLDWQTTAYAGWKGVDSFFEELDEELASNDQDELKNLAILTGKVAQKHLSKEWVESRLELILFFNILAVYGAPFANKYFFQQSKQSNDK